MITLTHWYDAWKVMHTAWLRKKLHHKKGVWMGINIMGGLIQLTPGIMLGVLCIMAVALPRHRWESISWEEAWSSGPPLEDAFQLLV